MIGRYEIRLKGHLVLREAARRAGPARAGTTAVDNLPAEHIELDLVRRLTTPPDEEPGRQAVVEHLQSARREAVEAAGKRSLLVSGL